MRLTSGIGEASPKCIVIFPVVFGAEVIGAVELGAFQPFSAAHLLLLEQLALRFAVVLNAISVAQKKTELGNTSRMLAEELEIVNAELAEKVRQLTLLSEYKSEFLANMSHELRTPLTSLLILSQKLAENKDRSLSPKQADYSKSIHASAEDLQNLISDILDLSKVEAGKMTTEFSSVSCDDIRNFAQRNFSEIFRDKGVEFKIVLSSNMPAVIRTDGKKLQQILRNLLSNAFKFTEKGSVVLTLFPVDNGSKRIALEIRDTGIGIPAGLKDIVFEAFAQADNSLTRKYGGTGLGLSISQELAHLLQGEISLESREGFGSAFTLFLPQLPEIDVSPGLNQGAPGDMTADYLPITKQRVLRDEAPTDDRKEITAADVVLLLIEDDAVIAKTFLEIVRANGCKGVVATGGPEALRLAEERNPAGIILDLDLADSWSWVVLDKLRRNQSTRHIPVGVICGSGQIHRALQFGIVQYVRRPANQPELAGMVRTLKEFRSHGKKRLGLISNSEKKRDELIRMLSESDIDIATAVSTESGIEMLREKSCDLIVLHFGANLQAIDFARQIKLMADIKNTPILICGEEAFTAEQRADLLKLSDSAAVQEVTDSEKLFELSVMFLHRAEAGLPESKRLILRRLAQDKSRLKNRKIMIVDDDSRNIIAVSSILEDFSMRILHAGGGKEAIEGLRANPDTDLVLMDIMLPEIDGFETTRMIRQEKAFAALPIIALTARAMSGDREKCLQAGASDHMTKPIDMEQLIAMLRVWLS